MQQDSKILLFDIISKEELKRLLDTFCLATGLGAIYVNPDGSESILPDEDQVCSFCKLVRADKKGEKRCDESMCYAGNMACQIGEPYIARCHAGLVELSAPIMYQDIYLGSIACGPVMMWDWDEMAIKEFTERTKDLDVDELSLISASRKVKVLTGRNVQAAAELLFIVAGHIAEGGIKALEQRHQIQMQQSQIAEMVKENKAANRKIEMLRDSDISKYPIEKENELISCVKVGNNNGAKDILNELLSAIFLDSSGNNDLIKARVMELLVVISRAAIEAGASTDKLFILNNRFISELYKMDKFEDICMAIVRALDEFLDTVYVMPNIKNAKNLSTALEFIRQNYTESLTLDKVSKVVYLSPYYLSHLFREELDITFVEYLTRVRIERAKYLLKNDTVPIITVASNVGYEDPSYFSKVFKRNTGFSPNQYRKSQ